MAEVRAYKVNNRKGCSEITVYLKVHPKCICQTCYSIRGAEVPQTDDA